MFLFHLLTRLPLIGLAPAAIAVVAVGGNALTAGITAPSTNAGSGAGTINGYSVSGVSYGLNATDPSTIDALSFSYTITGGGGDPTRARVRFTAAGTWYNCDSAIVGASDAVTNCTISPAQTVTAADNLTIVLAD